MKLNLDPFSNIAGVVDKVISRFKPSLEEKAKAELDHYNAETHRLEVTKDERMAEHSERMQRLKIEQSVAQSKEAAKVRPMIGKVCFWGYGIAIGQFALQTLLWALNSIPRLNLEIGPPPEIPNELLATLLATTLGQGIMRTVEKAKNVEGNR